MDNPLVQTDPGLFIWTIVTFLVLLGLLAKFAWTPLLAALETRQNAIRKSLDDAQQAKQELERLNAESAQIIARARVDADAIITQSRAIEQSRHEAVDLSVMIASKIIQRNLTKEDNERLIDEALRQVEGRRH